MRGSDVRYGLGARTLHWLVAALFVALFGMGKFLVDLDYEDPFRPRLLLIHRTVGLTLALLMLARLAWIFFDHRPKPAENLSRLELILSKLVHFALYVLLFAIPITGFLFSGAGGGGVELLGFELPSALSFGREGKDRLIDLHHTLSHVVLYLVALHVAAVVKHHVVDKIPLVRRII